MFEHKFLYEIYSNYVKYKLYTDNLYQKSLVSKFFKGIMALSFMCGSLSSLFLGLVSCGELIRGIFVIVGDSSAGKSGIFGNGGSSTVARESSIFGAGDSSPGLQGESVVWYIGDSSLGLWVSPASGLLTGDNSGLWGESASASTVGVSCSSESELVGDSSSLLGGRGMDTLLSVLTWDLPWRWLKAASL